VAHGTGSERLDDLSGVGAVVGTDLGRSGEGHRWVEEEIEVCPFG
jgi:hypothetical protein